MTGPLGDSYYHQGDVVVGQVLFRPGSEALFDLSADLSCRLVGMLGDKRGEAGGAE